MSTKADAVPAKRSPSVSSNESAASSRSSNSAKSATSSLSSNSKKSGGNSSESVRSKSSSASSSKSDKKRNQSASSSKGKKSKSSSTKSKVDDNDCSGPLNNMKITCMNEKMAEKNDRLTGYVLINLDKKDDDNWAFSDSTDDWKFLDNYEKS